MTTEAGNDTVLAHAPHGTINLGGGADLLDLQYDAGAPAVSLTLTVGGGADVLEFQTGVAGAVTVSDFDPTLDTLHLFKVDGLADIDTVTESALGVTLVDAGLTLVLAGVTTAELTDAVFVPL